MPSSPSLARALALAAVSCWLVGSSGCKRSLVWLDSPSLGAGAAWTAQPAPPTEPASAIVDSGTAGREAVLDAPVMSADGAVDVAAAGQVAAGAAGSVGPLAAPGVDMAGSGGRAGGSAGAGAAGLDARYRADPQLPAAPASCPYITSGALQMGGLTAQVWVGSRTANALGALVIYWHGTGSSEMEAALMFDAGLMDLMARGGVLIALRDSTGTGVNTSTGVWYTDDFKVIDDLIGCTVQQLQIDPRRIYTVGCSSGGVQAAAMLYMRSNYIAAAALNSGGSVIQFDLQTPKYVPALITAHGSVENDVVILNFAQSSVALSAQIAARGGFGVDCNHGGGHCGAPAEMKSAHWRFLLDHPYGVVEEPYAKGLPSYFPSYCKITR